MVAIKDGWSFLDCFLSWPAWKIQSGKKASTIGNTAAPKVKRRTGMYSGSVGFFCCDNIKAGLNVLELCMRSKSGCPIV